jgi:hypothetical protein
MAQHNDGDMRFGVKYDELQLGRVLDQVAAIGPRLQRIAKNLGLTVGQVAGVKRRYRKEWDRAISRFQERNVPESERSASVTDTAEEVTVTQRGDDTVLRSRSPKIRTVDDLLAHTEVDMSKYQVAEYEVTKNEQPSRNLDTGVIEVTEYFRVYVKLKPKVSGSFADLIEQMVNKVNIGKTSHLKPLATSRNANVMQTVVIADPHIAKYAWAKSTGQSNWDVTTSVAAVRNCSSILMDEAEDMGRELGKRTIVLLGDYWHFDTINGTTTAGTMLDRDSRLQHMIEHGTDALLAVIDRSAETVPTEVIMVPGNHDVTLTWATQRILQAHYRDHKRVKINGEYTSRKYSIWGTNLFGYTHGDKAKKKLPGLMAIERKELWGLTNYREFHTGHFHMMEEKVQNVDGVLVRTAPALCPPDDWHAEHGFLGSLRAMESFLYHSKGGLIGTLVASPDFLDRD